MEFVKSLNMKKIHTLSVQEHYDSYFDSATTKYGRINRDKSVSYNNRITTLFNEGDSYLFVCDHDGEVSASFTVFSVTLKNGEFITKILAKNNYSRRGQYEVKGKCVSKERYNAFVGLLIRTANDNYPKSGQGWAVIR